MDKAGCMKVAPSNPSTHPKTAPPTRLPRVWIQKTIGIFRLRRSSCTMGRMEPAIENPQGDHSDDIPASNASVVMIIAPYHQSINPGKRRAATPPSKPLAPRSIIFLERFGMSIMGQAWVCESVPAISFLVTPACSRRLPDCRLQETWRRYIHKAYRPSTTLVARPSDSSGTRVLGSYHRPTHNSRHMPKLWHHSHHCLDSNIPTRIHLHSGNLDN